MADAVDAVVDNDDGVDLQKAFLAYKKKRQRRLKKTKRKQRQIPNEIRIRALANPDDMWRLRMRFVEQAKIYFGVPYAKKYWKPEDPEYHSRIFMDCCGLVRRVMWDLKKEFGFKLGAWNQCYQFDTLPIEIERLEDVKPGDLVFISAIYHKPTMKKQKHNLTHVEIMLGDGPKTIGSRWHKGKVQIFDSYDFKATSYHSPKYFFKSIDTWLMGICRSHCPQHHWKTRDELFSPTKRSIFHETKDSKAKEQKQQIVQEDEVRASESSAESLVEEEEDMCDLSSLFSEATIQPQ